MDTTLLLIHIIGGSIGLLFGTIVLLRKKGDSTHVLLGRIFAYGMLFTSISALILSVIRPNFFLFTVGAFTLYMVGSGMRYTRFKSQKAKVTWVEWTLTAIITVSALVFVSFGSYALFAGNTFGWVYIAFGCFGAVYVREDIKYFALNRRKHTQFWLLAHISRMCGSFIAALTAFLVVNHSKLPFELPPVALWLLPSLLVVPFIVKWSKRYSPKK